MLSPPRPLIDVERLFLVVFTNQSAPQSDKSVHPGNELPFEGTGLPSQRKFAIDLGAAVFQLTESQLAS